MLVLNPVVTGFFPVDQFIMMTTESNLSLNGAHVNVYLFYTGGSKSNER